MTGPREARRAGAIFHTHAPRAAAPLASALNVFPVDLHKIVISGGTRLWHYLWTRALGGRWNDGLEGIAGAGGEVARRRHRCRKVCKGCPAAQEYRRAKEASRRG